MSVFSITGKSYFAWQIHSVISSLTVAPPKQCVLQVPVIVLEDIFFNHTFACVHTGCSRAKFVKCTAEQSWHLTAGKVRYFSSFLMRNDALLHWYINMHRKGY